MIVFTPGIFDLLHVGHVAHLERCKGLAGEGNSGDGAGRLVVGVPSDEAVIADKGRPPVIPHRDRLKMIAAMRCVDVVIPYFALEFITSLEMIRPDILAVSETWGSDARHVDAQVWARGNGCRFLKLPYYRGESTTEIKRRILELN